MRDVHSFRYTMIEVWRERWPTAAAAAVSLLLAISLFALIWTVLHSPEPMRPEARIVRVLLVRPPPPPPEPVKETVQPIV